MKYVILLGILVVSVSNSFANSSQDLIKAVFNKYEAGEYEAVIEILNKLEKRVNAKSEKGKQIQGLVYYWKGMAYTRINEFELAEKYFREAIRAKYDSKDIYYEYGQVLYVSEKYKRARIAFKKSVKHKYKVAVSLYYIGFISQELKEYKKAVNYYNLIEKLPEEEKEQVIQASRMQIADVYLAQVERQPDIYNSVKDYVIPQYRKALDWDDESALASTIKGKIEKLQRKYELILFRMRNGRTTAIPPYYMRLSSLYGMNDNVSTSSDDAKADLATEDYSSPYYTLGAFGRYSIYPSSSFSYAPEISASTTKFLSDSETLKAYNTYFYTLALKTNYEFLYNNAPATIFTDIDYTYNADDADADDQFAESSTVLGLSLSSQLEFWKSNPSTFRLRYAETTNVDELLSFNTATLGYEQIVLLKAVTLFFFNQYAIDTYIDESNEALNKNVLTSRLDAIFSSVQILTPTLYMSMTNSDFVEDSDKGVTSLATIGVNITKKLGKKWYLTFDYSNGNQTGDLDADNYTQQVTSLNLDYIY